MGASPGAALAFLIAGPATNAATVTTISRVLGRRTMIIYLLTIAISAFGSGLLLDWLMPRAAEVIPLFGGHGHQHEGLGILDHTAAAVLVLVMTMAWWVSRRRGHSCGCEDTGACEVPGETATLELAVAGMNCSHCSGSIERTVSALAGVSDCRVYLDEGRAVIQGSGLDPAAIISVVEGLGFQASIQGK